MKTIITFFSLLLFATNILAQQKPTELDKSPMDISYWPQNYPIQKLNGRVKDTPIARVVYSRPQKSNRLIFDGIVKYKEMWRLGANEATEIEFLQPVKINGKAIAKGKFTLFCIPDSGKWTIILNKDNFCWGNYSYKNKNDILRIDIKAEKNIDIVEAFTIYFEEIKTGAYLIFMWDDVKAILPINL